MRALLSAVGTRGDIQPILAVAQSLRKLGHEVRLCVPPNFLPWAAELGFEAVEVGVEMRLPTSKSADSRQPPEITPEFLRKMQQEMPDLITDQFNKIGAAVEGCQVILGGNAHQYAARSLAEVHQIPYFNALYAPVYIPSPDYAPPPAPGQIWNGGPCDNIAQRWNEYLESWNIRALERINTNRQRLSLCPIDDVFSHIITDHPWLATDLTLAPSQSRLGYKVLQTGAWIMEDSSPLPPNLEVFLAEGEAPIYFGFGSMPSRVDMGSFLVEAARALGRRAIISRGWGGLDISEHGSDCITVGEINQQALFPRLAAIVHHGGAGTTHTGARAGVAQLVTPMFSDQFYWGHRLGKLGVGTFIPHSQLTANNLKAALSEVMNSEFSARAKSLASLVCGNGALTAASALVKATTNL